MLWPDSRDPIEIRFPKLDPLIRKTRDEIDIDVGKSALAQRLHIRKDVARFVQPSSCLQVFVVEGLRAKAYAIDAAITISAQFPIVERPRVGFKTDFFGAGWQTLHDKFNQVAGDNRWSSATKEDCLRGCVPAGQIDLTNK